MPDAPWEIRKTDPADQPPEHDPEKPWAVIHPPSVAGRPRRITRFAAYAGDGGALAFLLVQPEYRRKTSRRAP